MFYKKTFDKQILTFNSGNRSSGTNESPVFEVKRGLNSAGKMSVVSVVTPLSYYVINTSNNTLDFNEVAATFSVTIEPGNYNSSTLLTEMQTKMNAEALVGAFVITFDSSTSKYTWTNTSTFEIDPLSSIGQIIGVTTAQTPLTNLTYTGDDSIELSGIRSIFIESRALARGRREYLIDGKSGRSVLINIPLTASVGSINTWDNNLITRIFYTGENQFTEVDFKLTDINGNTLDLNGLEWEITIELELIEA